MTIELSRWSTDAERAPLLNALAAPPSSPPAAPAGAAPAAGRAGRAGRGGRAAAPPQSPIERLTTAIKAAPTFGFIWGEGPTGYSIKYAWRSAVSDGQERIVLAIDRRIGANEPAWPKGSGPAADADFTVIEMRIDGKGIGVAKSLAHVCGRCRCRGKDARARRICRRPGAAQGDAMKRITLLVRSCALLSIRRDCRRGNIRDGRRGAARRSRDGSRRARAQGRRQRRADRRQHRAPLGGGA